MLLSTCCTICGRLGEVVCAPCRRDLPGAPALASPLHLDSCRALMAYDDVTRILLTRLKNHHRRDVVAWLADLLGELDAPTGSVVTWAPTSVPRRRRRGFDQGELLARAVARRWGVPVRKMLRRVAGPAQSGRSARERRAHPGFTARCPSPPCVVLVDDVVTTGATITGAARALRSVGAAEVHGLVVARAAKPGSAAA